MQNHLKLGDCFVDIGAHVGEYSMIAAATIGSKGSIIALEPQNDDGEESFAPIAYLADDSTEPTRVIEDSHSSSSR